MSALPITEKLPPATLTSSPSPFTVGGARRTASSVPSPAALKDNPGDDATLPSTGIGEQVIDLPRGSGRVALVVTPSPAGGSVTNFWNESDSASSRKSSMLLY